MLTREIMGVFALGVLWLNTFLVVAAAFKSWGVLRELRARFVRARREGNLVEGRVAAEVLAMRRVTQTGRAITTSGPDRILFTDGPQSFEILGGEIETAGGNVTIDAAQPALSEVWTSEAREREASAGQGGASEEQSEARVLSARASAAERRAGEFDAAFGAASTNKGFSRQVTLEVRAGDRVWVCGTREGERVGPPAEGPLLVCLVDPIAWCRGRARLIWAFIALAIAVLIACTAVALWPPYFGMISTGGGVLCLAYFILVQPIGTAVRDRVRTPARRLVGGLWRRPTERAVTA